MPYFRQKAPLVEARFWDGAPETLAQLRHWLDYALVQVADDGALLIENRSGRVWAYVGEWVIRDHDGFYPRVPKLFCAEFEA